VFGELKIVASQDLGELGDKEGKPVVYDWKWYYNLPGLGLWIVLAAALVFVRENRDRRVLGILLPLGILNLVWSGFIGVLGGDSRVAGMFNGLFMSLTVGISVLWLLAHKLGRRNYILTFILSVLVMSLVGLVGVLSCFELSFSQELGAFVMILAIAMFTTVTGLVLAGWSCRRRYGGVRLCVWLFFWTMVASAVDLLIYMVVMYYATQGQIPLSLMLGQLVVVMLVLGLCIYVINLSFVILGFISGFYRERLYALLNLQPVAVTPAAPWEPDDVVEGVSESGESVEN
jgi:hypothetical protein